MDAEQQVFFLDDPSDGVPPKWWHGHGMKVDVMAINPQMINANHALLRLGTNVAGFEIGSNNFHRRSAAWWITWFLGHAGGGKTEGRRELEIDQLAAMFGLNEKSEDPEMPEILTAYGATCAVPGLFIRRGRYLNVPGPGSGWDGDANISIFVTDEIAAAVEKMIEDDKAETERFIAENEARLATRG